MPIGDRDHDSDQIRLDVVGLASGAGFSGVFCVHVPQNGRNPAAKELNRFNQSLSCLPERQHHQLRDFSSSQLHQWASNTTPAGGNVREGTFERGRDAMPSHLRIFVPAGAERHWLACGQGEREAG
ncbi:hypothetical protein ACFSOZ_17395 [Mesorhizobium newzealandense]|uniref:Uncharacterized protein n=2 Tax=Mesorhizobium TaxID=68287 RepID=A0ABW4UAJ9_9HYPH